MTPRGGSLTAVGIGIRAPSQATLEVCSRIEHAEKVYSLVNDPLADYWIRTLNANTQSLAPMYAVDKNRWETYAEIVDELVEAVSGGLRVCAVSYGHPGVFAYPFRESIRRVRAKGLAAEILPGISAEDCLFADLEVDPGESGCQSYEATDFLVRGRRIDPTMSVVLWQVGVIGVADHRQSRDVWNTSGLTVLVEKLLEVYHPDHEVVVYEAARLPTCKASIERVPLSNVSLAGVKSMSTLYIPPMTTAEVDRRMLERLRIRDPATSGR